MSGERGDIRHSELKDHEYRYYEDLKRGYYKVKISSLSYSCPFCSGKCKDDYNFRELLNHASRVASGSRSCDSKKKAKHVALERYMRRHLDDRGNPEPVAMANRPGLHPVAVTKAPDDDQPDAVANRSGLQRDAVTKLPDDDQYVAVANLAGIQRAAVTKGPSLHYDQYAAVTKPLGGDHCSKRDYYAPKNRGDRWYGWMAHDDDYHLNNIFGVNLCKTEELKTFYFWKRSRRQTENVKACV